jgi:hypothetical protein
LIAPVSVHHELSTLLLQASRPDLNDEQLFQFARRWVIAELQSITVNEYLPSLGIVLEAYPGYDPQIDASVLTEFSTAAMRFGHSQLPSSVLYLAAAFGCPAMQVQIQRMCNSLHQRLEGDVVDALLRGLVTQVVISCHWLSPLPSSIQLLEFPPDVLV